MTTRFRLDRVEDRAAGRERIAGRAGRAGDDQAVGDERREVGVVDGDVEPADAGERAAGDDDVVEGDVARVVDRLAAAQDPALERHPLVDREVGPSTILARTASSSPASAFERKPTLPRLMPRIGTSTSATARTARRNVPSPPSTTSASVVGSSRSEDLQVARLGLPVVDARASGTSRRRGRSARRPPRSSGCRRNRCGSTVTARVARGDGDPRRRSRRNPGRRAGGPGTRDCPPAR